MFYWMKRSSGGSDNLDRLGNMSKAEILRGIVTEKLSTAAQEILAVVERTVAGYEEEASGFRREIERQRRQLELLLQPRVKLERRDLNPDGEDHEVVVLREEKEEEEQHMQHSAVEDTGSLGLLWFNEEEDGDGDDGVDEEQQLSATSSRQRREDLKDPDYQITSRVISPRARSDRRKPGRPRLSDTQSHLDLRICILEDSQTDVLSNTVFRKYPVQQVRCPRGLQEADFLDLLRSTFPQLADQKPFDVFTSDWSKRLQPLRAKTLTPEEICRSIRLTGSGNSALYIRLKTGEDPQSSSDNLHPLQRTDDPPSVSATTSADETDTRTRFFQVIPPQSEKRKPGRPRLSDIQSHLDLRICILEDSQTDVLSNTVFRKYPVQQVRCPRGLQEADFLDLLRSTFPQLADQKPFDVFTSDRSRRLQPLRAKTLTPEEICWSIRLMGSRRTANSALYIRLKTGEDPQSSSDNLHPLQRTDDPPSVSATTSADETDTCTRLSSPRVQSERRKRGRPRIGEEPTHHLLRVCMLEDSQSDLLSNKVLMKSSVQEVQCPRGLQEADFLDLLRSAFPQLQGDDKQFDVFKSDRSRRLHRVKVKTMTPEEIFRNTKSSCADKMLLYIRLKPQTGEEEEEEEEELRLVQRNDEVTSDSPSSAAVLIRSDGADLSASPVQHVEGNGADVLSSSSASQQQKVGTKEADDGDAAESQVESSDDDDKDGDEALDKDVDWKPDPELGKPKMRRKRGARASGVEGRLIGSDKIPCKVCGVWYRILGSLIKHAWSHLDEAQSVCGVCGERFESTEELKGHLKKYQKTHECSYCRKSFSTITGLKCHTTLHTGNRPFKCDVCNKSFPHMSGLSIHRWVHVEDKPHKCHICPKAFGLKAQLRAHIKVHTGRDKYHCNLCSKSFYDLRSLTSHKATHSGERRYSCGVCGKSFKLPGTLKSHEKTHTERERPYLCHICCKTFISNCSLTAHMKTHSSERPFICIICSKGFISNGRLKGHMLMHTGEAPYGCSECGRFFKHKSHLNNHVRSHLGIKLFVCTVCGKACSRQEHLTVHMRTHNGERPYQCSVCDKAFTQSHCLKTHMKSHQGEENPFLNASSS